MADHLETSALNALQSERCSCGAAKTKNQSFCRECYYALPAKMRLDLWKPMRDGYAFIFDECRGWLRNNTNRFKGVCLFEMGGAA